MVGAAGLAGSPNAITAYRVLNARLPRSPLRLRAAARGIGRRRAAVPLRRAASNPRRPRDEVGALRSIGRALGFVSLYSGAALADGSEYRGCHGAFVRRSLDEVVPFSRLEVVLGHVAPTCSPWKPHPRYRRSRSAGRNSGGGYCTRLWALAIDQSGRGCAGQTTTDVCGAAGVPEIKCCRRQLLRTRRCVAGHRFAVAHTGKLDDRAPEQR